MQKAVRYRNRAAFCGFASASLLPETGIRIFGALR
jgi:hypothetical protein